jgi:hypothetical protein
MKPSYYTHICTYIYTVYITKDFTVVFCVCIYKVVLIYCTMEYTLSLIYCAVSVAQCVQKGGFGEVNHIRCIRRMCKFVYVMELKEHNWPALVQC